MNKNDFFIEKNKTIIQRHSTTLKYGKTNKHSGLSDSEEQILRSEVYDMIPLELHCTKHLYEASKNGGIISTACDNTVIYSIIFHLACPGGTLMMTSISSCTKDSTVI